MRHILIHRSSWRPPLGRFTVKYIHPPWVRFTDDPSIPIHYEGPFAIAMKDEDVTFYYPNAKIHFTLWTGRIEKTVNPSSSWE